MITIKENPNRKELLRVRDEMSIARKGKDILQDKIDALVSMFFRYVKERGEKRKEMGKRLLENYRQLIVLESRLGVSGVRNCSDSIPTGKLEMGSKNIMGVTLPKLEWNSSGRPFQFFNVPFSFENLRSEFEEILREVLVLGEMEHGIRILSEEIKKGRKVLNSLENFVIPELKGSEKWIGLRLEQIAREDYLRSKMLKKKLGIS